jgi:hypothetical protein
VVLAICYFRFIRVGWYHAIPDRPEVNINMIMKSDFSRAFADISRGVFAIWYSATFYCKNSTFTWWERLPAANIVAALCCRRLSRPACDEPFGRELLVEKLRVERLSRVEAALTKVDNPIKPKVSLQCLLV